MSSSEEKFGERLHRTDDEFHKLMSDFDQLMKGNNTEFDLPPPVVDFKKEDEAVRRAAAAKKTATASTSSMRNQRPQQNLSSYHPQEEDARDLLEKLKANRQQLGGGGGGGRVSGTSTLTSTTAGYNTSSYRKYNSVLNKKKAGIDSDNNSTGLDESMTSNNSNSSSLAPLHLAGTIRADTAPLVATRASALFESGSPEAKSGGGGEEGSSHHLQRASSSSLISRPSAPHNNHRSSNQALQLAEGVGEDETSAFVPALQLRMQQQRHQQQQQHGAFSNGSSPVVDSRQPSSSGLSSRPREETEASASSSPSLSAGRQRLTRGGSAEGAEGEGGYTRLPPLPFSPSSLGDHRPESSMSLGSTVSNTLGPTSQYEANREEAKREREALEASLKERAVQRSLWRQQRKEREEARRLEKEEEILQAHKKEICEILKNHREDRDILVVEEDEEWRALSNMMMAMLQEQQDKERADEIEEEAIINVAKQERLERLQHERTRFLDAEEKERWERRVLEFTRDLVWSESYEREMLEEKLLQEHHRLIKWCKNFADSPVVEIETEERYVRSQVIAEYETYFSVLLSMLVEEMEASERETFQEEFEEELRTEIFLPLMCLNQETRYFAVEQEGRLTMENEFLDTLQYIFEQHCEAILPIAEREMWQTIVEEAEARMKVEKEELRGIEKFFDGCSTSRQLVGRYAARIAEVQQEMLEYRKKQFESISEEELSKRFLMQQECSQDRVLIMEYFKREYEIAEKKSQERKKIEIEQAIRAAQIANLNSQSSSAKDGVKYKQEKGAKGSTTATAPSRTAGKKTVATLKSTKI